MRPQRLRNELVQRASVARDSGRPGPVVRAADAAGSPVLPRPVWGRGGERASSSIPVAGDASLSRPPVSSARPPVSPARPPVSPACPLVSPARPPVPLARPPVSPALPPVSTSPLPPFPVRKPPRLPPWPRPHMPPWLAPRLRLRLSRRKIPPCGGCGWGYRCTRWYGRPAPSYPTSRPGRWPRPALGSRSPWPPLWRTTSPRGSNPVHPSPAARGPSPGSNVEAPGIYWPVRARFLLRATTEVPATSSTRGTGGLADNTLRGVRRVVFCVWVMGLEGRVPVHAA